MELQYPLWLLAILPFLGLLFLKRPRKVILASKLLFRSPHWLDRIILRIRKPLVFLAVACVVYALAAPTEKREKPPAFYTQGRTMILCVDTSTSMGEGPNSSMEKIKRLTKEFARKRNLAGDYVSITAYSGHTGVPRGGAAIILPPTQDWQSIDSSINVLHSRLLGMYTATGEGLWVSLKAILKEAVYEHQLDFEEIRLAMETIGTSQEQARYLLEVANKVGSQKDKVIVLFTDGYYNTGIEPAKPLWLAKRLGIRVHFVAFLASAVTGLSQEEAEKRKALLAQNVVLTGGKYFESSDITEVARFYGIIDQIEKGQILVKSEYRSFPVYEKYAWLALMFFSALVITYGRTKI